MSNFCSEFSSKIEITRGQKNRVGQSHEQFANTEIEQKIDRLDGCFRWVWRKFEFVIDERLIVWTGLKSLEYGTVDRITPNRDTSRMRSTFNFFHQWITSWIVNINEHSFNPFKICLIRAQFPLCFCSVFLTAKCIRNLIIS